MTNYLVGAAVARCGRTAWPPGLPALAISGKRVLSFEERENAEDTFVLFEPSELLPRIQLVAAVTAAGE